MAVNFEAPLFGEIHGSDDRPKVQIYEGGDAVFQLRIDPPFHGALKERLRQRGFDEPSLVATSQTEAVALGVELFQIISEQREV